MVLFLPSIRHGSLSKHHYRLTSIVVRWSIRYDNNLNVVFTRYWHCLFRLVHLIHRTLFHFDFSRFCLCSSHNAHKSKGIKILVSSCRNLNQLSQQREMSYLCFILQMEYLYNKLKFRTAECESTMFLESKCTLVHLVHVAKGTFRFTPTILGFQRYISTRLICEIILLFRKGS